MSKNIIFEELTKEERLLLLRAFDYDIDKKGNILTPSKMLIKSKESLDTFLNIDNIALTPGSLEIIEGTPISISKYLREKVEINADKC